MTSLILALWNLVFVYSAAGDSVTYDALGMDETFVCDVATGTCE